MKKELKRQIKQDDLLTGLDLATHWMKEHFREVQIALVAALALGAGAYGVTYFRQARTLEAERAFGEALATFHAPLEAELPAGAPRPEGTVFKEAAERYKKAAGEFDGVERRYGSLPAGRWARYYGALARVEMGQLGEAEKVLQELAAGTANPLEASLARLALAESYGRAGKTSQAVSVYRQMLDDTAAALPKDHVLMRLGSLLEEERKYAEAGASYQRLLDTFPASSYTAEAKRRFDYLRSAS
ncbi:MAG TPA: tetratricopeptide repeat protein [Vicinamibacteria bacterium]|nr:tetratricopeptide repeat protein [Vicinamibacteria bacterium]